MSIQGICLCGKVKVELDHEPETFTICHCDSCRRFSGGVAMSFHRGADLEFDPEQVGRFTLEDSPWSERGFCKTCGTNLFYRLKKSNDYFLYLGLFGDQIHPRFDSQEYIDHKPDFYHFAEETKTTTEAEGQERLKAYLTRS
ncbi:MAG: aldehyde-activating protein [Verrucomicrobiales bacterium]|nr:aldehyde-activating protein [Verrucomicrobiales bacterium]|tara:strand:+ start:10049 stop:10474 length:426 start_codon:yes stop_codon:yes gene_type:complete